MAKTEESKLEQEVDNFMKKRKVWKLARYQAQSSQNGLPDRLYLYKGILLGLELKTDKGSPTDLQIQKLKAINDNGGIGLIITKVKSVANLIKSIDTYNIFYNDKTTRIKGNFLDLELEDDDKQINV